MPKYVPTQTFEDFRKELSLTDLEDVRSRSSVSRAHQFREYVVDLQKYADRRGITANTFLNYECRINEANLWLDRMYQYFSFPGRQFSEWGLRLFQYAKHKLKLILIGHSVTNGWVFTADFDNTGKRVRLPMAFLEDPSVLFDIQSAWACWHSVSFSNFEVIRYDGSQFPAPAKPRPGWLEKRRIIAALAAENETRSEAEIDAAKRLARKVSFERLPTFVETDQIHKALLSDTPGDKRKPGRRSSAVRTLSEFNRLYQGDVGTLSRKAVVRDISRALIEKYKECPSDETIEVHLVDTGLWDSGFGWNFKTISDLYTSEA